MKGITNANYISVEGRNMLLLEGDLKTLNNTDYIGEIIRESIADGDGRIKVTLVPSSGTIMGVELVHSYQITTKEDNRFPKLYIDLGKYNKPPHSDAVVDALMYVPGVKGDYRDDNVYDEFYVKYDGDLGTMTPLITDAVRNGMGSEFGVTLTNKLKRSDGIMFRYLIIPEDDEYHIWDMKRKYTYTDGVWLTEWNGKDAVAKKIDRHAGDDMNLKGEKYCEYTAKILKYAKDKGIGPDIYRTETDDDGNCYILTEYLPTIYDAAEVKATYSQLKKTIVAEINTLVDKMHGLGLYHGDVRARNVGRTNNGKLVFIDWDHARFINDMKRDEAKGKLTIGGEKVDLEAALDSEFIKDLS